MNKNILIFLSVFLLLGCHTTGRIQVTPEQAAWQNFERSYVRSVRFRPLGEGKTVTLYFKPHTFKEIEVLPGYTINSSAIEEFRQDHVVFREVNFPFRAYLRYQISAYEGTGKTYPKLCELSILINEERNWDVFIYH